MQNNRSFENSFLYRVCYVVFGTFVLIAFVAVLALLLMVVAG